MSRRRIASFLFAGAVLLLIAFVLASLFTPLGVSLLRTRMQTVLPGVSIARVEGSLGRSFRVVDLRYENERVRLHIARASVTPRIFGSLGGEIGIDALDAEGVQVLVKPRSRTDGRPVPRLPAIDATAIRIRDAVVTLPDGRVLRWSSITGGFRSRQTLVTLRDLQARGADSRLDGALAFDVNDLLPRTANLRADVKWDTQRYVGTIVAQARGAEIETRVAFASPLRGDATIRYAQSEPDRNWRAKIEIPAQRAEILPDAIRDHPIALSVDVAGNRGKAHVAGSASVAGRELAITDGRLVVAPGVLRVETLVIEERGRPGRVSITGAVPRDDSEVALELALASFDPQWKDTAARIDGTVAVRGPWSRLVLQPQLRLAVPEKPDAEVTGTILIEPETLVLEPLEVSVGGGKLVARGAVPRETGAPWTLAVVAEDFDPGVLFGGFDGKIDAQFTIGLAGAGDALQGHVTIASLEGDLRGRPVTAQGSAHIANGEVLAADIAARSGRAELTIKGGEGAGGPLIATLAAPALSDIAPGWQGAAEASITRVERDVYEVALTLRQATIARFTAGELLAKGRYDIRRKLPVDARILAADLAYGDRRLDTARVDISAEGDVLVATGEARAGESRLAIDVRGQLAGELWSGVIDRLDIARGEETLASLAQPAPWRRQGEEWSVDVLCLTAKGGRACTRITHTAAGGDVAATLEALPLAAVLAIWKPDFVPLDGAVSGTGAVQWSEGKLVLAKLALRSEQGRVAVPDRADVEVGYRALVATVDWSPTGGHATLSADLDPTGRIEGRVDCAGDPGTACTLTGQIDARVENLEWLEALTPELMETQGRAAGRLVVSGTAGKPLFSGNIRIEDFVAYVPRLAIKLQRGEFTLQATHDQSLTLDGTVWSGDGRLHLAGTIDPAHAEATVLKLTGENVLIANTPTTRVRATPALELHRRDKEWQLTGRIDVPEARIDVSNREAVTVRSADVVVVDDPPRDPKAEQPWNARIVVALGDDVRVEGLGFDGKVRGELKIRQRRNGEAIATGQLGVSGRYDAYGQKLKIKRGQLLYANAPLDNPTLSIRAERELRDATAGVDVGGTALEPELTVFARPAMSDSEALSLLVTGRRLRDVRSSERGALGSAAVTLGTVGGDMLAQSIGGPLGLDEIGIGGESGLDGTAFTFGKYLSPRLFVGYGIGLLTRGEIFTVRFRLTDHLELEAQSGAETRAALNYRIER